MPRRRWPRLVAIAGLVAGCDGDGEAPGSAVRSAPAEDHGTPSGGEPEPGWFTVWPELESSVAEQARWSGTLRGSLWRRPPGPWLLCRVVEESFPPGCEYGVPIGGEPSAVQQGVAPVETSSGVEWTDVTVEISGEFDPAAIEFVESP